MTAALEPKPAHVLLISPLTFSYHQAICKGIESLGAEATWWNDRASAGSVYKLALRLLPRMTKRASERHFMRLVSTVDPAAITDVLVIKGEGLSRQVLQRIRAAFPNASMGLYLWDGIENVPGVLNCVSLFDSVSTFDAKDASEHGWDHRPLFARNEALGPAPATTPRFDWCFVGTLHSDRHRVISALRDRTPAGRSFVFGYLPGKLVKLLRFLTDKSLWSAPAGTLTTTSMSAADVAKVVASSASVLDVEHPQQRGLTMRTIETLLAGKKLVTTNELISASDLFDPSRVEVIDRKNPVIRSAFLTEPFVPVSVAVAARYSCAAWAAHLLGLQRSAFNTRNTSPGLSGTQWVAGEPTSLGASPNRHPV